MGVTFNKPAGMKYTDMAIWIDAHLPDIQNPDENPEIEAKVYEYIYHIVYALACKSGYFKNFIDYDNYACYAASELYFSMRKKLMNAGKVIRGKVVKPIKSSLNFIKATMFPLKVNYQRENFALVLDPNIHDGLETLDENLREGIRDTYRPRLIEGYTDTVEKLPMFIREVVEKTPFRDDRVIFHRLYISVMLTLLNDVTIPNKLKKKITSKVTPANEDKVEKKLFNAYKANQEDPIMWHLDEKYSNYIKILTIEVKKKFSKEMNFYIHGDELSDELIDNIMHSVYENYANNGDYE